ARPVGPDTRELANLLELVAHVEHEIARLIVTAEETADHEDRLEDLIDGPLVAAQHGGSGPDQLRAHVRLHIRERQHQSGLQLENAVERETGDAATFRLGARLRRPVSGARDANDTITGADRIADLDVLGAQADDAAGKVSGGLAIHRAVRPRSL